MLYNQQVEKINKRACLHWTVCTSPPCMLVGEPSPPAASLIHFYFSVQNLPSLIPPLLLRCSVCIHFISPAIATLHYLLPSLRVFRSVNPSICFHVLK